MGVKYSLLYYVLLIVPTLVKYFICDKNLSSILQYAIKHKETKSK